VGKQILWRDGGIQSEALRRGNVSRRQNFEGRPLISCRSNLDGTAAPGNQMANLLS
jgi:hypothetical protein